MNVLPYGDRAMLAELPADEDVLALRDRLVAADLAGVGELVPGARTLLVCVDPAIVDRAALNVLLHARVERAPRPPSRDPIELYVDYDGADLADVARQVGATVEAVIRWHCAPVYTVSFCGFAPGFAYLRGLDARLVLPRLTAPRARVPAGSVAIAAEYSAVYPSASPGGWRLLGRTEATLWDLDRTPPALLDPGARVRFVPR